MGPLIPISLICLASSNFTVEMFFRNESQKEPYVLQLPGCKQRCPLPQFLQLTEPVISQDWKQECQIRSTWNDTGEWGRMNPKEDSCKKIKPIINQDGFCSTLLQNLLWLWLSVDLSCSYLPFCSWQYSSVRSPSLLATATFPMKERSSLDNCFSPSWGSKRKRSWSQGQMGPHSMTKHLTDFDFWRRRVDRGAVATSRHILSNTA